MRIVNTFHDLDLLERLFPVCGNCEHMGFPLNIPLITDTFGDALLIVDYKTKLKCVKCGSKDVHLNLISNMAKPDLDDRRHVYYSDDLRGGYDVIKKNCSLPFAGVIT